MSIQKTAAEETIGFMLPTRKVESFHYTDLRAMLRELPDPVAIAETAGDNYQRLVPTVRLPFYDGQYFADLGDELPSGVTITNGVAKANSTDINDAIVGMNAVTAGDAIEVRLEGSGTAETPLEFAHVANSEGSTACYHKVTVRSGGEARILDRYVSGEGIKHLSNSVCELVLERGAKATWMIVQQENSEASRLARINVSLAEDSDLSIFILNAGGKLVRQEVNVSVDGENANLAIRGVNLVGDHAHIDVTTVLEHNVPNTNAEELFRNVVAGDGHGIFQGQIKVGQPAQKTDAQMACNTLLLTDEGDFSAKPELEIFADDVICAHGATVTDIDDEHMFYLRARGLDEKTARSLLIKAFVDEVVEEMEADEILEEALRTVIDNWLDANI